MNRFSFLISSIVVVAVIAFAASPVSASVMEYTDEADFKAALSSYYQEWFDDHSEWDYFPLPVDYSSGSYSYTASAPQGLWAIPWDGAIALSVSADADALLFTNTGSSVNAAGGYFFGTDFDGFFVEDTITITVQLDDSSTTSYTTGASAGNFRGYISDSSPITSLTVSSTGNIISAIYATVDGFIVGTPVPEPSTLALLATGLIGLLCYAWRKRK